MQETWSFLGKQVQILVSGLKNSNEQVLHVYLVSFGSREAQFMNFEIHLPSTHASALNLGLRRWSKKTTI